MYNKFRRDLQIMYTPYILYKLWKQNYYRFERVHVYIITLIICTRHDVGQRSTSIGT